LLATGESIDAVLGSLNGQWGKDTLIVEV